MPRYDTYATPRADLGEAIREFDLKAQLFIAVECLPLKGVKKKASTMSVHTRESLLKRADAKRAPRSAYNRIGVELEDLAYECKEYGLEGPLEDSERSNFESDFDAELETTEAVEHKLLSEQEIRVATLLFNTTTWTGAALYTNNSAAPWATAASGVIAHVLAAKAKVRDNTGVEPNALIISGTTLDNLLKNDGILARFPGAAVINEKMIRANLAAILGLEKLIVGKKRYDSAKEGQAFSSSTIWSDSYAMVAKISTGSVLSDPGLGKTMLWTADSPSNVVVEEYREEQTRSDIFRVRHNLVEKVFDKYFAHLMLIA